MADSDALAEARTIWLLLMPKALGELRVPRRVTVLSLSSHT
jgi:hypothetical protein